MLLLEVLIAFSLVVMVAVPLMYPQVYLLKTQRKFISEVELDHVVNLTFAKVVEDLYKNSIAFGSLQSGIEVEIAQENLQGLPFKGTYKFRERIHKPKTESLYTLYSFVLEFKFVPLDGIADEENTFLYSYDLFVVRDLGQGELPAGSTEDETGEIAE